METYADRDDSLKKEKEELLNQGISLFNNFYQKLSEIKDYHSKFEMALEPPQDFVIQEEVKFSGEEGFGRFLDLHSFYDIFINLEAAKQSQMLGISYLSYLSTFYKFEEVSPLGKDNHYKQ